MTKSSIIISLINIRDHTAGKVGTAGIWTQNPGPLTQAASLFCLASSDTQVPPDPKLLGS